jgi:hypothetical protein
MTGRGRPRTLRRMTPGPEEPSAGPSPRGDAGLAPRYRRALELAAAGADAVAMAHELDVAVESIPLLLRIARAKAAHLGGPPPDGPEDP